MKQCDNCGKTENSQNLLNFNPEGEEFINWETGEPTQILICRDCTEELGGELETQYWVRDVFIKKSKKARIENNLNLLTEQ